MNVAELIDLLNQIEDKTLPVRLLNSEDEDLENVWLDEIEVSSTGTLGYERSGEVRLIGSE